MMSRCGLSWERFLQHDDGRPAPTMPTDLREERKPAGSSTAVRQARADSKTTRHVVLYAVYLFAGLSIAGSLYSALVHDAHVTNLRSRLPASAISALQSIPGFEIADHHAAKPPAWLADKRNVLNQYGVKLAWLWTTLAFVTFVAARIHAASRRSRTAEERAADAPLLIVRPIVRYALATLWWYLLTQSTWFGSSSAQAPSITQRVLEFSGAQCVAPDGESGFMAILEPELCRPGAVRAAAGAPRPYWHGGHDVSGHTFLLVHASLFLVETIAPVLPAVLSKRGHGVAKTTRVTTAEQAATAFVLLLVTLWAVMLLTTSVYFHTLPEKLSGLVFGLAGFMITSLVP